MINAGKGTWHRQGFTLIEILVAVMIISMAVLPLIMLSRSDNFHTSFNDAYMIGLTRGKRISASFDAMGYDELKQLSGITTIGNERIVSPPLPLVEDELKSLVLENNALTYLKHFENRLKNYTNTSTVKLVAKGIYSVRTVVAWTIPGENGKLKEHGCHITTFVTDPKIISTYGADN